MGGAGERGEEVVAGDRHLVADSEVGERRHLAPLRFDARATLLERLGGVREDLGNRPAAGRTGWVRRRRRGQLGLGPGPQPLGHPAYLCLEVGTHRVRPVACHEGGE